jgi:acyl-CoA thioesterase FadM
MNAPAAGPFEADYRIRFDEAGPDGLARASTLLRLAHDAAWRHSGHLGFDRAWYLDRGLAWLVRTIDLDVRDAIPAGARLTVDTEVTAHGRITARRRSGAWLSASATPAAVATTDWVLIDARGRPTRVPPEFTALFGAPTGNAAAGRVTVGPAPPGAAVLDLVVRWPDLDPNGHVNNAVHLDWLDEAVRLASGPRPEGGRDGEATMTDVLRRRYRIEYLAPLALDDAVTLSAWQAADGWSVVVARGRGGREVARGHVSSAAGKPA